MAADSSLADLWWALRGGGGGTFGVVVEIEVRRHNTPEGGVSSLTCDWPLNADSGATTPGRDLLDVWFSGLMQSLSESWTFYTIGLPAPM